MPRCRPLPFVFLNFLLMERVKVNMEFIMRCSPEILYRYFLQPAILVRWFCDSVDISGDVFTFEWSGSEEVARLVESVENERLRFEWLDDEREGEYLEYRISKSPITGETILEITDFCDEDEVDDTRQLWESQIDALRKVIGA